MAAGDWECTCGNTLRSDQLTCSVCHKTYKLDAVFNHIVVDRDPAVKNLDPHLEPPVEKWAKEFKSRPASPARPSDESMREVMREAKVRKFKKFFKR